jgi:hypothetical protein
MSRSAREIRSRTPVRPATRSTTRPTSISASGSATATRTSTHSACSRRGVPPTLPRHPLRRPPPFLLLRRRLLHPSRSSRRLLLRRRPLPLPLLLLHPRRRRPPRRPLQHRIRHLPRPSPRRQVAPLKPPPGRAPQGPDAQTRARRRFVPSRSTGLDHPGLASSLHRRADRRCQGRERLVGLAMRRARSRHCRGSPASRSAAPPARPNSLSSDAPHAEEAPRPGASG